MLFGIHRAQLRLVAACSLALIILAPIASLSQTNTGRLTGIIVDSTGAAISEAQAIVIDNQTMNKRVALSDPTGSFSVPLLDVGSYTVTISRQGFRTFKANNVIIEVGREYPLHVILEIGPIETVINVSAEKNGVRTSTAELGLTVHSEKILNLPLDTRNPLSLVLLQGGTSANIYQNTSINGQRTAFTNITRDGINIQDAFIRNNATNFAPGRPSIDDTEEFTITSQNAGADQGYGAAQIQMVTPRGSAAYHGGLWEFNRNSAYGANDFFNNKAGVGKPFRNRNQLGGKSSGVIPGFDNKLFFFGFYEALRDIVTTQSSRALLLPDARNGIFTYIDNSKNAQKINLFSLTPQISTINPIIGAQFLSEMPQTGNRPDMGDKLNTEGITFNQSANTDRDTFTTRIDYIPTTRQNINVVFSRNKETNQRPDQNNTEGFHLVHPIVQSSTNKDLVAASRWANSAGFSNEIRGGIFLSEVPFQRTTAVPDYFLIPYPSGASASNQFISNPEVTYLNQGRNVRSFNLQNGSEFPIHGHSLRFGAQMQMFQVNPYNYAGIVPTFQLGTNSNTPALTAGMFPGGISATQLNNANTLFAVLGGIISSGARSFNVKDKTSGFQAIPRVENYRYSNYSFYISDQWRPAQGLVLNFGMRYEILTPVRLLNGLALEPVIQNGADPLKAILDPNGHYDYIGGNAGGNNRLYKTDWNNVAPVLGFAYTPKSTLPLLKSILGNKSHLSIRGGFRQSYVNDSILTTARNAISGNYGLGTTAVSAFDSTTGSAQLNLRPESLPSIAPPGVTVPRTFYENNGSSFGNFGIVFAIDPNIQTTRINEYYLGIQRALGGETVFEIRYVGSRSNNLWRAADYNQIDIRHNGFADDFNRARRNLLSNGNPSIGESLTVFPLLANNGQLSNSTNQTFLRNGTPADMAYSYITSLQTGSVNFLPNPNIGVVDFLTNGARYRYDSLQVEVRRQLSADLSFQANYTWQKILTDAIGTSQSLLDTFLDLENPKLEYARADYDTNHIFNFNSIYRLPIGKEKPLASHLASWINDLIGGWQLSGIMRITSGPPITIVDPRGTLNRAARSARQTPDLSITATQLKFLTGHFENANGIYFIDPSIINPATGRAAEGYGTTPFSGQVLFNAAPGSTGALGRAIVNGPGYFNIDMSLIKSIYPKKGMSLQLRMDAFNVLNHTNYYLASQLQNINSTTFGKLQNDWSPRVVQIAARLGF
jgi:hypothetical protein